MFIYLFISIMLVTEVYTDRRTGVLEQNIEHYRNRWMVHIPSGWEAAREIAETEGFLIEKELPECPNVFKFYHPRHPDEGKYENKYMTSILKSYSQILWAQQLTSVKRETRSIRTNLSSRQFSEHTFLRKKYKIEVDPRQMQCPLNPNAVSMYDGYCSDPYFAGQWYMHDCRKPGSTEPYDNINVIKAWEEYKLFGKGVVVLIIDDGLETDHYDLRDRYNKFFGRDYIDDDNDPNPEHTETKKYNHGTKTGGVLAMSKNNQYCGVGVAPEVTLGAVRLIGPKPSDDEKDGAALLFRNGEVDIVNNSWGPQDNGVTLQNLGQITRDALKTGITTGRRKKGTIYIFAGGNGKRQGDMCGCDAFVNSIYTITVASADYSGILTWFSERCAAVMVTAYSGDKSNIFNVISTDVGIDKCTTRHSGTSASAPMISGGIAIVFQIRPDLSWRDIPHLLAYTSQIAPFRGNKKYKGWMRNKAGFYFSTDVGFGMIDIYNLVTMAKTFKSVPPMSTCVKEVIKPGSPESMDRHSTINIFVTTSACEGSPFEVNYIEHVQVYITLSYSKRGDVQIELESASGTNVRLLEPRSHDNSPNGFYQWTFDSLHAWGESPKGTWKILIFDNTGVWDNHGIVTELKLIIHGTKEKPAHYEEPRTYYEIK